jgi:hypothetical protein
MTGEIGIDQRLGHLIGMLRGCAHAEQQLAHDQTEFGDWNEGHGDGSFGG